MGRKTAIIFAAAAILAFAGAAFADEAATDATDATDVTGVTVTGQRIEDDPLLLSPGVVSVIKLEDLKGEQKNLPEVLKQVPGLHVVEAKGRGAYTVASIRGSTAAEVNVFVDGVLMNLGSEAAVDLTTIPIDNVEQIEVYRGYIPARFGGAAIGGVINIITKKTGGKAAKTIELGIGDWGTRSAKLSVNDKLGSGNFLFGANIETTDGDFDYLNDNNTPYTPGDDYKTHRQNNDYTKSDLLFKWNNDDWRVRMGWKMLDRTLPYSAPGADKPTSKHGADYKTEDFDFQVGRTQKFGKLELDARFDYRHQYKKYDDPENIIGSWSEQHNIYKTNRFGFNVNGSYQANDRHLLEFMADYAHEKLDVYGDIITTYDGYTDFKRQSGNFQLQDMISLDKEGTFLLTPIIRYNRWAGEGKFSAAFALSKQFGAWDIRTSFGKYNRAPSMYELYGDGAFVRPNLDLDWESGLQWDLSVTWTGKIKSADVRSSLTYFGRDSDDLIEYIMINPRYGRYFNIGEAEIHGVEWETNATIKKWDLKLSATYMHTKNKSDDYRNGAPLPNRPKHEVYARVTRRFLKSDAASAFIEARYIGENYYDGSGTINMGNYTTTNLGFKWEIAKGKKISVGVNDVFDKAPDVHMRAVTNGPARTLWYPMQGRTFYATFTYDF